MKTERDEAIDILGTWCADNNLIRVQGSFQHFAFASQCRILSVDKFELRLLSDDTHSELVVRFAPHLEYGYGDNRSIEGEEKKYGECLMIFLSPVVDDEDPDYIALAAIKLV